MMSLGDGGDASLVEEHFRVLYTIIVKADV